MAFDIVACCLEFGIPEANSADPLAAAARFTSGNVKTLTSPNNAGFF